MTLARSLTALGLLALLAGGAACAAAPAPAAPGRAEPPAQRGRLSDYVLIVSLDGLRPDAIARTRARTLQRLLREGSHSLTAQTILPSRTLPGHMSMLSGKEPQAHRVLHNDDPDETRWTVDVPTVFRLAHEHGFETVAFFSKKKFRQLYEPHTVAHATHPTGWLGQRTAEITASRVERHLRSARPQLVFVHFAEPDNFGHLFGWMSGPYRRAVEYADVRLARILAAADRAYGPGNYTVLVSADHGGHRFTHGSDHPLDTTIPWLAWGRGVRAGTTLPDGIRITDTAATALWLLGIPIPERWVGRPVRAAFAADPP